MDQSNAPIVEALNKFQSMRIVPFDVPGHKRGKGNLELTELLGEKCLALDVNSMKSLDNLGHPTSVIREAEELAAKAFGAGHVFFMVNGTTSAVQSMILASVKRGDKIILPRNIHKSVINALVLSGAHAVYVPQEIDKNLGIALGMNLEALEKIILEHLDAKAVFINNPTYYGICSDIKSICKLVHKYNMLLLADEAHGTHFYFAKDLPLDAIKAGADFSSVSMHKSGGSLTQSSFLLCGKSQNPEQVGQIVNLTQTTSASYLLLASLDLSRKNLALNGTAIFEKVKNMASYAREEINEIGGYYAYGQELIDKKNIYDFDITKLSINTTGIGLAGIEVYDLLRDEYDIQVEFGDTNGILAYISVGDRLRDLERLVSALSEIKRRFQKDKCEISKQLTFSPIIKISSQDAFYAEKEAIPVRDCVGMVTAELVMCYPPGIPILAPGEQITEDLVEYICYAKEKGCFLSGTKDAFVKTINVIKT